MSVSTLDIRELIERFEELETELQEAHDGDNERAPDFTDWVLDQKDGYEDVDNPPLQDEAEEYLKLKDLFESIEDRGGDHEWRGGWYPSTLIADYSFVAYAQEMAESIGAVPSDLTWPCCYIDWDAAADALKSDYTSATYDGEDYWYRS